MLFIIFLCGVVFGTIVTLIIAGIVRTVVEIREEKERLLGLTERDEKELEE